MWLIFAPTPRKNLGREMCLISPFVQRLRTKLYKKINVQLENATIAMNCRRPDSALSPALITTVTTSSKSLNLFPVVL